MAAPMPTFGRSTPVIGDLLAPGHRRRLEIWCGNHECGRHAFMEPEEAVARLGADTTFTDAGHKLVCSACGARGDGPSRLVQCRGSIEDYYKTLGQPMPDHRGGALTPSAELKPTPHGTTHRRRGRRRGGW